MLTLQQLLANIPQPLRGILGSSSNSVLNDGPPPNPNGLYNVALALNQSPATVALLNAQVIAGTFTSFVPLTNASSGAEYSSTYKTIALPIAKLTGGLNGGYNTIDLAIILAHEGR